MNLFIDMTEKELESVRWDDGSEFTMVHTLTIKQ